MAFIPSPHAARAVIKFAAFTQEFSNVLHFTKTEYTDTDMAALADALDAAVVSALKSSLATAVAYSGVDVYDIRTVGGNVVYNTDGIGTGSDTAEPLPVNLAIVVTLRTQTRGRSGRGRVYVGGFSEDKFDGEVWSAGAETAAEAYIQACKTNAETAGWGFALRSIQQDQVKFDTAVMRPITSFGVRNRLPATQRRRIDRP